MPNFSRVEFRLHEFESSGSKTRMKTPDVEYWRKLVEPFFSGKKTIVAMGSLSDSMGLVKTVQELGARVPYILASSLGSIPTNAEVPFSLLGRSAKDSNDLFRKYGQKLGKLPRTVIDRLDQYDSGHKATVLMSSLYAHQTVGGRTVLANRKKEWLDLEDKTVIDSHLDRVGIDRIRSVVVASTAKSLRSKVKNLDEGLGTVWAGDSKQGYNGGASYIRIVRDPYSFKAATRFFSDRCNRIRVSPFVEGIPCSIHGIVFKNAVIALRPVEMLVFEVARKNKFIFAGSATFWDPPPDGRKKMRDFAKRIGTYLRDQHQFLGTFTLDGIFSKNGFVATEVNPRYGAAMPVINQSIPRLPLSLLDMLIRSGKDLPFKPKELERMLLKAADSHRSIAVWCFLKKKVVSFSNHKLNYTGRGFVRATKLDRCDAELYIGPSEVGGVLRGNIHDFTCSKGSSSGLIVKCLLDYVRREIDPTLGQLIPAKSVSSLQE
jgi:hypothetical protein